MQQLEVNGWSMDDVERIVERVVKVAVMAVMGQAHVGTNILVSRQAR